ncbi:MAG: hypothetical protein BYD32DRAFT_427297 [Podila humilis]|nr:MAG: hypothetical protein BYD32DRAFT_427297 [Podila humilis]
MSRMSRFHCLFRVCLVWPTLLATTSFTLCSSPFFFLSFQSEFRLHFVMQSKGPLICGPEQNVSFCFFSSWCSIDAHIKSLLGEIKKEKPELASMSYLAPDRITARMTTMSRGVGGIGQRRITSG